MLDAAVWEQAAHVLRRLGGAVESKIAEHLVDDPTEEALRRIELCFDTENRQRAKLVERLGLLEDGADAADDSALVNRAASERRKLERSGIRYWGRSNTSVSACAANSQRYALPWKYRSPGPTAGKVDARP